MKNSTLLRLFFISIGLPLTYASSSPPTSSTPTPSTLTTKSNTASLLVDTTNTSPAVQLKDQGILVQSTPEEAQVSGGDKQTERFKGLIDDKQYDKIAELGKQMSKKELLKCFCQVVTTLDHFEGLFGYLKQRNMVPSFLAHGGMVVKKVIVESDLLKTDPLGWHNSIYDAIFLSLNEDRHERVACLFEAAHERPAWKYGFDMFVYGFFERYSPEENSMPLKRFFTLHGGEFSRRHPEIFETICQRLVLHLKRKFDNQASQKLLIDLIGQPSLLTPVAFAGGFLSKAKGNDRANFINYGYREAIKEGLKEGYREGGIYLWEAIVVEYPNQFPKKCPRTDEARTLALENFKHTKQSREEEWAKENAPILLKHLEMLVPTLLPTVLLGIVSEYAITWIIV